MPNPANCDSSDSNANNVNNARSVSGISCHYAGDSSGGCVHCSGDGGGCVHHSSDNGGSAHYSSDNGGSVHHSGDGGGVPAVGKNIVCIAGPTASGKTTLGVLLARRFGGEVVSADSMQIYQGMAVGTAAPSAEERQGVPHHLIAVADPAENWSAARYVEAAVPVADGILSRGKLPVVVGGTGLWMEALVKGRAFAPGKSGGAVRRELERRLDREGIAPLLAELRTVDPEAAARLHPADTKRILRALEVYRESGETITEHDRRDAALPLRYRAVWIGLRFRDRADLRALIARRVEAMLEGGLLEEARALYERNIPPTATAWQAIGYKELRGVLEGKKSLREAAAEIVLRTGQYAKRQETWFRRNPAIHWIEWEKERDFSHALQVSTELLERNGICWKPRQESASFIE